MSELLVTVTGPAGSGKSTAGRSAAQKLGLDFFSAGELFRAEAKRKGMDLAEFSLYAEQHDEVDRSLDEAMLELARRGHLLEGRITGALCHRRKIPVLYVVVTAREEVRLKRLAHRDGQSLDEARRLTHLREQSEEARYRRLYGIDLDREPADLTVDSSDLSPAQVEGWIVERVGQRSRGVA
ncbi:MAG: cytidylate kinase family protein [Thermoplasmata archaeon]|nr:cytidylate kinase family protein [Thermoplasmata archaeon]